VRDWEAQSEAVAALGATVYVVTADTEEGLAKGIDKHGLRSTFVQVERGLWAEWGIANPKRPNLPWPSTVVIASDGTILELVTHEDHRERAEPTAVLERIRAAR